MVEERVGRAMSIVRVVAHRCSQAPLPEATTVIFEHRLAQRLDIPVPYWTPTHRLAWILY
jgi:hypothetical protein